eukprot:5116166-Amphidinium_carterae.1
MVAPAFPIQIESQQHVFIQKSWLVLLCGSKAPTCCPTHAVSCMGTMHNHPLKAQASHGCAAEPYSSDIEVEDEGIVQDYMAAMSILLHYYQTNTTTWNTHLCLI